MENTKQKGDQY